MIPQATIKRCCRVFSYFLSLYFFLFFPFLSFFSAPPNIRCRWVDPHQIVTCSAVTRIYKIRSEIWGPSTQKSGGRKRQNLKQIRDKKINNQGHDTEHWTLNTRHGRSRGGACRRRHQFRKVKGAIFHREPPPPLCFFQNKVGYPPCQYKKFKRKTFSQCWDIRQNIFDPVCLIVKFQKNASKQAELCYCVGYSFTLNLLKQTGSKMLNRWIKSIQLGKKHNSKSIADILQWQ